MWKRVLWAVLIVASVGLAAVPRAPVVMAASVYSVTDYGAIGDGDVANAAVNTTAFNAAIAAASNPAAPGVVDVPPTRGGFVVNNGAIAIASANVSIRGQSSMGSNLNLRPTSCLVGHGPGHTLTVSAGGGSVRGLSFKPFALGEQAGADAFLYVTGGAVSISDIYMRSPNIGVSFQLPTAAEGEFWLRDMLVEGQVKVAGISANAGNAAVCLQHVIMFSEDPQPPYGVLVTSCGELVMGGGCDIISMGTCLALVPGLNGVKGQHANAVFVSDCLFDSPNGNGVYVAPQADGYASLLKFTNCWASTQNNNGGTWPANGFTLDGSKAIPPAGVRPIMDATFTNCSSRNFVNHCGWYAKQVYGLTVANCTASGNFVGIQTYGVAGILSCNKCGDYTPGPLGFAAGNRAYGVLLEKSQVVFNPADQLLGGNGVGPFKIIP